MRGRRHPLWHFWPVLALIVIAGMMVGCTPAEPGPTTPSGLHVRLLVKPPDGPLPLNRPVDVKSRTEDAGNQISHVELYAVQLPNGAKNILIRSDPAPFPQTTFTASQVFVPAQPGDYVIKVVGYNRAGDSAESDYIGFRVQ